MSWLTIVTGLISLAIAVVEWVSRRGSADTTLTAAILKGLRESDDAIKQAQAARNTVRDDLARDPSRLRDDDGFRRDGD